MSGTFTIGATLTAAVAENVGPSVSTTKAIALTSDVTSDGIQSIATSATALTFGNISGAPAVVYIQNLDATNYVEIDSSNTFVNFPQKIPAGAAIALLVQTGTIYGRANTSAVRCRIVAAK